MPRSLLIVATAVAVSLLGDQMLYTVLPVVYEQVGLPVTAVGLLLSANRLVRLLTNPLAGYVVGRWGRPWPFVLALLLGALTTVAYGVFYGIWMFLLMRLLWGTAWSFIRLEGLSTVLDVATPDTRGRYMGAYQAISRLGSAVAMLAGGLLTDYIGFRTTFVLFGFLSGSIVLPAYYTMHRQRQLPRLTPPVVISAPLPEPAQQTAQPQEPEVTTTPEGQRWRMMTVSLATFSAFLVGALVSATLGYTLRQRFGLTLSIGSLSLGVASLTGFLLSSRGFLDLGLAPCSGYLADRWGRHRLVIYTMPVAIVSVMTLAWQPPLPVIIAAVLCTFVAASCLNVVLNAVAGDVAPPQRRSMFLSLFVTWQDVGAALGPLVGYWIAPRFGVFALYLAGASVLLVVAVAYTLTFSGASPRSVVQIPAM